MSRPINEVKIWPWKPGDQGYACMPLKRHVPHPKSDDWKMINCPACGAECWESDLVRKVKFTGVKALCTECAIRAGIRKRGTM